MNLNVLEGRLFETMGELYKPEWTPAPLHHNTDGLSKSVDFETGLLLYNFVKWKKPKTIVELGTFRGYSTSWLRLGAAANGFEGQLAHVHAFEVFKEGGYGPMWYDRIGFDKTGFTYHEVPGGIWKFEKQIPPMIDLLFHDTQHLVGPTQQEMALLLPRVPVGGTVLVDDMCYAGYEPMQDLIIRMFSDSCLWRFDILRLGHGLGIAERLEEDPI